MNFAHFIGKKNYMGHSFDMYRTDDLAIAKGTGKLKFQFQGKEELAVAGLARKYIEANK